MSKPMDLKVYFRQATIPNDLTLYSCGRHECMPGHMYSGIRENYLIHYIEYGKGYLNLKDKKYILRKGQGFICPANVKITYQADLKDPWTYYWVAFNSIDTDKYLNQIKLNIENPIYNCNDDSILNLMKELHSIPFNNSYSMQLFLSSRLYYFLYLLSKTNNNYLTNSRSLKERHVENAVTFISQNYSYNITVENIAKHISIDRKYLCKLFKEHFGITTQEFLIKYRINKAITLINNSNLSIKEVSYSVGYEDSLVFSKVFKKIMGICPTAYKK